MRHYQKLFALLTLSIFFSAAVQAQTTAFTYQGKLTDGTVPANGTYPTQFALFETATGGTAIASQAPNVTVINGIFTVTLDFGANAFDGNARYLEITVGSTTLSPRQPITSAPYAIRSSKAALADDALLLNGVAGSQYVLTTDGRLSDARPASSVDFRDVTLVGFLPILNGGTGSSTKDFVDLSTNQTVPGRKTFPNGIFGDGAGLTNVAAVTAGNVTGVVQIANGGTGSPTQNFVDLATRQTGIGGDKTFTGVLTGNGSGLSNVPGTLKWQVVTGTSQQALSNNGYVANDSGQVTITLPANPVVGDVVRVSGIGVGGWKIAQNAGQLVLLNNLGLLGTQWTAHEGARSWTSIASSADGNKLVATVQNGLIYTSTDAGETWVPRDQARPWNAVTSSSDGSKLVAGDNLTTGSHTSIDSGVTWTTNPGGARFWKAFASSSDGTKIVGVEARIYTSIDSGVSWTVHESSRQWSAVASSSDGTKLVAVDEGGLNGGFIYTSIDSGGNWTPGTIAESWSSVASSADGTKLVATAGSSGGEGTGKIYTSTDSGGSWTEHESDRSWTGVASSADGTKLVAVSRNTRIYISSDSGVSWTPSESPRNWSSVASSADGSKLVATGQGLAIYTSTGSPSSTTTAGPAGYLIGGTMTAIELQYIGNGQFLPISHEGTIFGF